VDSLIGASIGAHRQADVDFPAKLRGPGASMAGEMDVYHEYKLCRSMYSIFYENASALCEYSFNIFLLCSVAFSSIVKLRLRTICRNSCLFFHNRQERDFWDGGTRNQDSSVA